MHPSTAPRARAARHAHDDATPALNPATAHLLRFFAFDHLPPKLQEISQPFAELAERVAHELDGPEATACLRELLEADVTVCLRKLLEAKDCAVRAALS
jgi:hypothetical protein